jgi:hypothetical protein
MAMTDTSYAAPPQPEPIKRQADDLIDDPALLDPEGADDDDDDAEEDADYFDLDVDMSLPREGTTDFDSVD